MTMMCVVLCALGVLFFVFGFLWYFRFFHVLLTIAFNLDGEREAAIDGGSNGLWIAGASWAVAVALFGSAYALRRKSTS